MDRKKKRCRDCDKPSYIKGHGRCSYCYNKWYAKSNPDKLLKRSVLKRTPFKKKANKSTAKPKKTRKQKLVQELDRVFSLLIRLEAANDEGICRCYTCDKALAWKRGAVQGMESAQACHYLSRGIYATRWYKPNVKSGCNECNVEKSGNLKVFKERLEAEYGKDCPDRLYTIANTHHSFTEVELSSLLYKLRKEYQDLKKLKGL